MLSQWSLCDHDFKFFFFYKQKTAYEMRISDLSSDVCSSDLRSSEAARWPPPSTSRRVMPRPPRWVSVASSETWPSASVATCTTSTPASWKACRRAEELPSCVTSRVGRSEEHTSELQSLMRISYAVFCLKKKTKTNTVQKQDSNQRLRIYTSI